MQVSLREIGIRSAKWTTLASAGVTVLNAVQLLVLAMLLSPSDFGTMSMVLVLLGLAQIFSDSGISAAIVFRQKSTEQQLSSLYWLNIAAGILVFLVVWFLAPYASLVFEPQVPSLLRVAAIVFLVSPIGNQFKYLLQRDLKFEELAKQEVISAAIGVVTTISFAMFGFKVWSLVLGLLASTLMQSLLLFQVGLRQYRPLLHFRQSDLRGYLSFGAFQMGEKTSAFIGERIDQILIGSTLGSGPLGIYWFALNLTSQPISRINPIVNRVAFPLFAKIQDDRLRLRRGYLAIINLLNLVNAPMLLGMAAVSPLFVPSVFGEKWTDSIILIQILSLVALSRTIGNPIGSLLLAVGWADRAFYWTVIFLLLNVPGVYIGGLLGGAVGIACSLLILQIGLQIISYFLLLRPILGGNGTAYISTLVSSIWPAFVMGIIVYLLPNIFSFENTWKTVVAQILTGISVYCLIVLFCKKDSFGQLKSISPQVGSLAK